MTQTGSRRYPDQFDRFYAYIVDSQDIEPVVDDVRYDLQQQDILPQDVTAAFVLVQDGDYSEVWVTESPAPYYCSAAYYRVR